MKRATIIGISDRRKQWFAPEVTEVIASGTVFSGGKRHREIMSQMLPSDALWIDITVPLSAVFERYAEHDDIIVFASGDPLFYGFANTVMRMLPECNVRVYPTFNSLQTLAHKMCLPYHDMHVVSLTGRPWDKFDEALINGEPMIGVLTDKIYTPKAIVERMNLYGYQQYSIIVGYNLGNENDQHIEGPYTIADVPEDAYCGDINCVILQCTAVRHRPRLGIPEQEFYLLNGRAKMITKMPVRLQTLAMMGLHKRYSMWDVGFCTGSVSIEAKLQYPHLKITAFEIRPEGEQLMVQNSRKFGAPGITAVIGDFLTADVSGYERPDAVFVGGHGGKLKDIVMKIKAVLKDGGCIVFNSVSEDSRKLFLESIVNVGMSITSSIVMAVDDHNPITIMKAE